MLINEENARTFFDLFLKLSIETAKQAHQYIESHDRIRNYCKYPVKDNFFTKEDAKFKEIREKVPFLFYDIPRYELRNFPENSIQYGAIFERYDKDCLDCTCTEEYKEIISFIDKTVEVKKVLDEKQDMKTIKHKIKRMNTCAVERYMYSINATKIIPTDLEEKIKPFALECLNRYIQEQLDIDIYVPICLVTFDEDFIKLSEDIEITRISEEIQQSRHNTCVYESINENDTAACATHMIVIHNYHLENSGHLSINSVAANYHQYPLHIIDDIMAALRIITGYTIGYCQLLMHPIKWIDGYHADLITLYGAKTHFINSKESEKGWLWLPVSKVNHEQIIELQKLYKTINEYETGTKAKNLLFALKRFNRCLLRNEDDDMAIDATIGLEALLSGGTKGEITYTISNRIPIVFLYEKNDKYLPTNCRGIMRKIYNYRSKIVHGGAIKEKDKYYEINDEKIEIERITVDFLRYTLLFILHNEEFLDSSKFDDYLDANIAIK